MNIEQQLLQALTTVPTPASVLARVAELHLDSVRSRLTALHKAGRIRAESIWMPHSKKPVLFYFLGVA